MSEVGRSDAGMAGGAVSTARYIGGVIGISVLGYLLGGEQVVSGGPVAVDAHGAATAVYSAALVLAAISALVDGKHYDDAG